MSMGSLRNCRSFVLGAGRGNSAYDLQLDNRGITAVLQLITLLPAIYSFSVEHV